MPKPTTREAKETIGWAFDLAGKVKRPMTFYVGTAIMLMFAGLALYLWPFSDSSVQIGAMVTVGAIMIADFHFVYRWASKRLEHDPQAFSDE